MDNHIENRKRKRKKNRLVRKFFTVLFSILFIYFTALGGYITYTYLNDDENDDYFENNTGLNVFSGFFSGKSLPERTTVLLLGVDADETRTDTIMLACFNSVTNSVDLISIPRDTKVKVPKERYEIMKQNVSQLSSREMKINAVHAYGGEDGVDFLKAQIEEMLDIEIDYYAKVNFEGFHYIIDSIGGVKFNVEDRLYYNDGAGFVIDLYPGEQILDGEKAEQLVRNRYSYAMQDLDRVQVQQKFLKAFMAQALQKDTILSNPKAYITTLVKYVDTDFGITDAVKYFSVLESFDAHNITGHTLPGEPEPPNGAYYLMNKSETEDLVYEIFKKPVSADGEQPKAESSTNKDIIILNGGYTTGLAGRAKRLLEDDGFNVISIGDEEDKAESTKIYVKKNGQGEDLIRYFTDGKIIIDEEKTKDCDILIILGTNEELRSDDGNE